MNPKPAFGVLRRWAVKRPHRNVPRRLWRPVALRWRRYRDRGTQRVVNQIAGGAAAFWMPQLHLHFTTWLMGRVRAGNLETVREARSHLVSSVDRVQTLTASTQVFRSTRHDVTGLLRRGDADAAATSRVAPGSRSSALDRGRPRLDYSAALRPPGPTRESSAPEQRRTRQHLHFLATTRVEARGTHVFRAPAMNFANPSLPPKNAPNRATTPSFDRRPELVLRRGQDPGATTAGTAGSVLAGVSRRASLESSSVNTPRTTATAAAQLSSAQTVAKLDPGLMDRLADDVIRRVERRVRIDRERRGL